MFSRPKTVRWYALTLFIVFLVVLFSANFDSTAFIEQQQQQQQQVDTKVNVTVAPPVTLHVNEPGNLS